MLEVVEFFKLVGTGMAVMLPMANPMTSMTLLVTMGKHLPRQEKNRQIFQAACYVVGILLVTYYIGHTLIHALDISMPGIRIAGGLIIAFIGFSMLFPKSDADSGAGAEQPQLANIAFVPLALPGTAGPGSMAMVLSASSQMQQVRAEYAAWVWWLAPVVVAVMLGVIFWACLRAAPRIVVKMGPHGIDAMSRVMGFLLICIVVQFCIDGIGQLPYVAGAGAEAVSKLP